MPNNKGFTLIELLAVIVILAIILLIAVPNVLNIIERTRNDAFDRQKAMIENTARKYVVDRSYILPIEGTSIEILLQELITANLLDEGIKDPRTGDPLDPNTVIIITNIGNNRYTYVYDPEVPEPPEPQEFTYTNPEPYIWEVPLTGRYKIEVWGAEGGVGGYGNGGGLGGYTKGEINLVSGEELLILVGSTTGYNGGGNGYDGWSASGGGATDVRLGGSSLNNRIIVAGGGGGGAFYHSSDSDVIGGTGGGYNGGNGEVIWSMDEPEGEMAGTGATQNEPGTGGAFGQGGYSGGGGWYGGGWNGGGSGYYGGMINDDTRSTTNGARTGNGRALITYIGPVSGVNP
jgi:prepilin-type N-terminal cleavage/methylation domain-containing protein